jgi:hypothetical protein
VGDSDRLKDHHPVLSWFFLRKKPREWFGGPQGFDVAGDNDRLSSRAITQPIFGGEVIRG